MGNREKPGVQSAEEIGSSHPKTSPGFTRELADCSILAKRPADGEDTLKETPGISTSTKRSPTSTVSSNSTSQVLTRMGSSPAQIGKQEGSQQGNFFRGRKLRHC